MVTLDNLVRRLETLRSLDAAHTLSGAKAHGYRLNPPLAERDLQTIETKYRIALPSDYRSFLREIGNGGAGPGYGMCPFGKEDTGSGFVPWTKKRDPSKPFPQTKRWDGRGYLDEPIEEDWDDPDEFRAMWKQWSERNEAWWTAYLDAAGIYRGTIPLCHYGDGETAFLVVNGASAGQVWSDRTSDEEGLAPQESQGRRIVFREWYAAWLAKCERALLTVEPNE